MKDWVNRQIFFIALCHHTIVVSFRLAHGRLYVMRDRPLWFVKEIAEGPWFEAMPENGAKLLAAAKAELQLRIDHPRGPL